MTRAIHLLPVVAVVAVVLLCCAGAAAYLGWIAAPAANGSRALPPKAGQSAAAPRCGRCGVIEAVREVDAGAGTLNGGTVTGAALGQQLAGFSKNMTNLFGLLMIALAGEPAWRASGHPTVREITVRFEDGSRRVLTEAGPAARLPGDRVKVVSGRLQPAAEAAPGG